jgi:septal ring factor EnvC (AmiA/AmiB activator)
VNNQKHIEVVTDYAIENQKLKQEYDKLLRSRKKLSDDYYQLQSELIDTKIECKNYRDTIKQTIQHLENMSDPEDSYEDIHRGMVGWLNSVLEGNW